jgi:hypothetical protein
LSILIFVKDNKIVKKTMGPNKSIMTLKGAFFIITDSGNNKNGKRAK